MKCFCNSTTSVFICIISTRMFFDFCSGMHIFACIIIAYKSRDCCLHVWIVWCLKLKQFYILCAQSRRGAHQETLFKLLTFDVLEGVSCSHLTFWFWRVTSKLITFDVFEFKPKGSKRASTGQYVPSVWVLLDSNIHYILNSLTLTSLTAHINHWLGAISQNPFWACLNQRW